MSRLESRTRRLEWRVGRLVESRAETSTAKTLVLDVPDWPGHDPGQHIDIRLTAPDGYTAQRSYSLAAPADGDRLEVTVQEVADGEVSAYLIDVFAVGDEVELRGPVGGWFVWRRSDPRPVLLVAGGSGIVPLMAMLRARLATSNGPPFRLVYSVRSPADRFYAAELDAVAGLPGVDVRYVYTRATPDSWPRPAGRIGPADITPPHGADDVSDDPADAPACFVCGPTSFVEAAANLLVAAGHHPSRIKTERFGPTGETTSAEATSGSPDRQGGQQR